MGHDTENLVGEKDLNEFKGIILSPLNREPAELMRYINEFRSKGDYDIILDPQLYFPRTMRGKLQQQPYFPSDIDTADISSSSWWKRIINLLYDYSHQLQVNALASPTILPKVWSDDYFSTCSDVSQNVSDILSGSNIRPLTTVLIHIGQLTELNSVFKIASILSEADSHGYYIVFESDVEPRREFTDSEELYGAMCLIRELENTGRQVIVSQCSSDMILFKAAGAANCATSKFFNLRRFTKSRYDEETGGGGGQLPYWFEHSLLAFLREEDILRLKREGYDEFVGTLNSGNYWANEILEKFREEPGKPWVALGWRQYLSWFGKTEADLSNNNAIDMVKEWLKAAEELWLRLDDDDILFDEPRNNGAWLRPWRQALIKFSKDFRDIIRL
jgi:hypothetical protein